MSVKIRLTRVGGKNDPHYRIVVKTTKSNRDGKSLEILGHYNPKSKEITFDSERINYWMSVGAQPTATVKRIAGLNTPSQKPTEKSSDQKKSQSKKTVKKTKST